MKSVKNIVAMLVLVTVMGVSSTFGGIYMTDRSVNGDVRTNSNTVCVDKDGAVINTGILVTSFTGILVTAITGVPTTINTNDVPACNDGITNEGILVTA